MSYYSATIVGILLGGILIMWVARFMIWWYDRKAPRSLLSIRSEDDYDLAAEVFWILDRQPALSAAGEAYLLELAEALTVYDTSHLTY